MADDTENPKKGKFLKPPELENLSDNDKLLDIGDDWWNNACVNLFSDKWRIYAMGYKKAADVLVVYVEDQQRGQDILVYPIVFLYRQYLELVFKNLIRRGRMLVDNNDPFPQSHDIGNLWDICRNLLDKISPEDCVEEQAKITRLINEFCQVDPISTAFRYPEKGDGKPSLPAEITHINLQNIKEVMDKISRLIEGAISMIDNFLDIKGEMQREMM